MAAVVVGGLTGTTVPVAVPGPQIRVGGIGAATGQDTGPPVAPRVVLGGLSGATLQATAPPPASGPQFYRHNGTTWVLQKVTT